MPFGTHTPDQVESIPMYPIYGSPVAGSNALDVTAGINEPLRTPDLDEGMYEYPLWHFTDSSGTSATRETDEEALLVVLPLWPHQQRLVPVPSHYVDHKLNNYIQCYMSSSCQPL